MDRVSMNIKQTPAEVVSRQPETRTCMQKTGWTTGWLSHREARGKITRLDAIFAETTAINIESWRFPMVLEGKEEPWKKMEDGPGK